MPYLRSHSDTSYAALNFFFEQYDRVLVSDETNCSFTIWAVNELEFAQFLLSLVEYLGGPELPQFVGDFIKDMHGLLEFDRYAGL